jgi:hypothetical protein
MLLANGHIDFNGLVHFLFVGVAEIQFKFLKVLVYLPGVFLNLQFLG